MIDRLYRLAIAIAGPFLPTLLTCRLRRGKEDPDRLDERMGIPSRQRPDGLLIWIHGASVGESLSALPLIDRLLDGRDGMHILMTTGTLTSALLMKERLPSGAFHQFIPLDRPDWMARFLDHWHPDLALMIESELWPAMLEGIAKRRIPVALVNARMSRASALKWRLAGSLSRRMLGTLDICLAQTDADGARFRALGATHVRVPGNLKYAAAPLPFKTKTLGALKKTLGDRPVWLMASTHPGEEIIALQTHRRLCVKWPDLLTVIAPRHSHRGPAIADLVRREGWVPAIRSQGDMPDTGVYIADTMGEMGLLLRLAPIAVIGGSFVPHGGHNPIEAATLGAAILYGPHMFNFSDVSIELETAGGARRIDSADALPAALDELLSDPNARDLLARSGTRVAESNRHVVKRIFDDLTPLLAAARIYP